MTLCDMQTGDVGVMLTVPRILRALKLRPGERVRLITTDNDVSLIEAQGVRLALSHATAAEMILTKWIE